MTATDGPVTFLNIFEIPREDVAAFTVGWRERIALVDGAPGFRGAQLLEAVSEDERFQLVNVTQGDRPGGAAGGALDGGTAGIRGERAPRRPAACDAQPRLLPRRRQPGRRSAGGRVRRRGLPVADGVRLCGSGSRRASG